MEIKQNINSSEASEMLSFRFFYLMTIGVLLTWVMVSGIVDTTVFARNHFSNFIRVFFIVGLFGLALIHKYTRIISLALFVIGIILVVSGFYITPEEPNFLTEFAELISNSTAYILGNRGYHHSYERFIIQTISFFFSFFVAFFTFYKFQFWILFPVTAATTAIAITSPYFRNNLIFYVYALCLLALIIRYLQLKNLKKTKISQNTLTVTYVTLPVILITLFFSALLPTPPTGFSDNFFRDPFDFINNLFLDLTQQSEFSLRQVGFGGNAGRLGGDITPNDNVFMEITTGASMPLYLTGAIRDTYTGNAWENRHNDYQQVDLNDYRQMWEIMESEMAPSIADYLRQMYLVQTGRLVPLSANAWHLGEDIRIFTDPVTQEQIWAYVFTEPDWYVNILSLGRENVSRVSINNLDRRLTTLFHSGVVRRIDMEMEEDDDIVILRNRENAFQTQERLRENTTYSIRFLTPNFDQPSMMSIMESGSGNEGVYEFTLLVTTWDNGNSTQIERIETFTSMHDASYIGIFSDIHQSFQMFRDQYDYELSQFWFNLDGEIVSYEDILYRYLIPRANQINYIYTQLPDALPERVRELALEVTADGGSNLEKMRLLEDFLSQSFPYTLTPGPSPANWDFVDHFLFDLQRGYCVHFATAFVVMARSLGIPARYVEGFYVNQEGGRDGIEVLNSMAHAWPEVYFEGFGWVRFEPTPASGLVRQPNVTPGDRPVGGDWHEFEDGDDPYHRPDITLPGAGEPDQNNNNQNNNQSSKGTNIPVWSWLITGFIIVISASMIRMGHLMLKRERISRKIGSKRILAYFEWLLCYLKELGFEIDDSETSIQFANRIRDDFSVFSFEKDLLEKSAVVFAKARYGNQPISKEEYRPIEKLIRKLDRRLEDKFGKIKYLFYRHILGKF